MKAIIMDLRNYESLTTIIEDINSRLKKLGAVECISCYFSQTPDERFTGFSFSYAEPMRRDGLVYQVQGIRYQDNDEVESFVNEELGRLSEAGYWVKYLRVYWRREYTLALMTIGRRENGRNHT